MTRNETDSQQHHLYRTASLGLSIVFAAVGGIFLIKPAGAFHLFNNFGAQLGLSPLPVQGFGLYHILAVGYMYLVTLLAVLMYRDPGNRIPPILLINGKAASSFLSFFFFMYHCTSLLYLANGIIDGTIALAVFLLYRNVRNS